VAWCWQQASNCLSFLSLVCIQRYGKAFILHLFSQEYQFADPGAGELILGERDEITYK